MRHEFIIKTDCAACSGVIKEIIKKIEGVKSTELEEVDSKTDKMIIDYEGELSREELAKIIKEKTGYEVF